MSMVSPAHCCPCRRRTGREAGAAGDGAGGPASGSTTPRGTPQGLRVCQGQRSHSSGPAGAGGGDGASLLHPGESRATAGLLPDICLKIVRDMYFPKNMRWGYQDVRFSRPIRWLVVALWGETVIPFDYTGLVSDRTSHGHRWLGGPVEIEGSDEAMSRRCGRWRRRGRPPRTGAADHGRPAADFRPRWAKRRQIPAAKWKKCSFWSNGPR